jgi:hypothetical protein
MMKVVTQFGTFCLLRQKSLGALPMLTNEIDRVELIRTAQSLAENAIGMANPVERAISGSAASIEAREQTQRCIIALVLANCSIAGVGPAMPIPSIPSLANISTCSHLVAAASTESTLSNLSMLPGEAISAVAPFDDAEPRSAEHLRPPVTFTKMSEAFLAMTRESLPEVRLDFDPDDHPAV